MKTHTITYPEIHKKSKMAVLAALSLIFALFLLPQQGCSNDNEYDEMPSKIQTFVSRYFPSYTVEDYDHTKNGNYQIRLKKGPGITFDSDQSWITINGYGLPLPQVLMFDQLPPALYDYLDSTGNQANVFSVERNRFTYSMMLLDETLTYDIATARVTVNPIASPTAAGY